MIPQVSSSFEIFDFFYVHLADEFLFTCGVWFVCLHVREHTCNSHFVFTSFQSMVAGPPGQSGLCAIAAVDEDIRNAQGPAPTQHHSMVVPSVKGRVCRK